MIPGINYDFTSVLKFPPSTAVINAGVVPDANFFSSSTPHRPPIPPHWPPHIKPLKRRINYDALRALPGSDETLDAVDKGLRYMIDGSIYASVLPSFNHAKIKRAITPAHFTQPLLDAGHFEVMNDPTDARGSVFVFGTPELTKQRVRVIQHPAEINKLLPPAPQVKFRSIRDRCQQVHAGSHAAQADFMGYYTQFPLSTEVSNYMTSLLPVQDPASQITSYLPCRLRVAPTGLSHMVYVAVSTTNRLKDFPHQSAAHDDQIDNVLFIGEPENIVNDFRILAERCEKVGVTFNEDVSDPASLLRTDYDWCGIHQNLTDKTVSLTQKVTDKLRLSWSNRDRWSVRGFAAHCGLLFYAMQILDIPVARFFNLLKYVSRVSQHMQAANDTLWDAPIDIWPSVVPDLEEWTSYALANEARFIHKDMPPDVLVLCDASAVGWGYTAFDTLTGNFHWHGERWSQQFVKMHGVDAFRRSTFTETQGLLNVKLHLLNTINPTSRRSFLIGSDSTTAVAVHRRRYASRSYRLNCVALSLISNDSITRHQWAHVHIPGKQNTFADQFSRGRTHGLTSEEQLAFQGSLQRLLGVIPAEREVVGDAQDQL